MTLLLRHSGSDGTEQGGGPSKDPAPPPHDQGKADSESDMSDYDPYPSALGTPRVLVKNLGRQTDNPYEAVKIAGDESSDWSKHCYKHHRWRREQLCGKEDYDENNTLLSMVTMQKLSEEAVDTIVEPLPNELKLSHLRAWFEPPAYYFAAGNRKKVMWAKRKLIEDYRRMYWRFGIVGIDNDQRPRKKLRGMTLMLPHELPAQEQEWNEISLAEILLKGGTEGDLHYRPKPQDFLIGDGSFENVPDSDLHMMTVPFSKLDGPERSTSTKDRAETEWKRR